MITLEIDYDRFIKLPNRKIIDLRDNQGGLLNAIKISFDLLIIYPERYLDKNTNYLLICDLGLKSLRVSKILNNNGYKTYSLIGGYKKGMKKTS